MQIDNVIKCLEIVKRENPNNKNPITIEEDVIILNMGKEYAPESSVGKELIDLGAHWQVVNWYIFV